LNLKALVSQRLIPLAKGEGRAAAVEVMINTPLMSDLIFKGQVHEIKELISKSTELGMQTFDQHLFEMHEAGTITYEDALRNADSVNDLRLRFKLESKGARKKDLMHGLDEIRMAEDTDDSSSSILR
jgi:twitching motility protein PilU